MKKWRVFLIIFIANVLCMVGGYFVKATDELSGNLFIVAVNPGYSTNNIGELIELKKLSDNSLSLAGVSLIYVDSEGTEYALYEFDEGDEMTGESLLFRYKKAGDVIEKIMTCYTR